MFAVLVLLCSPWRNPLSAFVTKQNKHLCADICLNILSYVYTLTKLKKKGNSHKLPMKFFSIKFGNSCKNTHILFSSLKVQLLVHYSVWHQRTRTYARTLAYTVVYFRQTSFTFHKRWLHRCTLFCPA